MQALNDIMSQLDLIDIYRAFYPKPVEFTLISSAQGTVSRVDHILGLECSLGKFKRIEVIPCLCAAPCAPDEDMAFTHLIDFHKKSFYGAGIITAIFQLNKLELK